MLSDHQDHSTHSETRLRNALIAFDASPSAARNEVVDILRDDPDFLSGHRALARILRLMGDEDGAARAELEAISRGIQRSSFVAAQEAFLAGNLDIAEPLIRKHLREDPKDPAGALMLGEIAARCGAKQEAENLFTRAILLAPAYIEPRFALAKHQRDLGRYADALDTLGALLAKQSDFLPAMALQAAIFVQLRRIEEADAAFIAMHELHPSDARGWANHAFMLKTVGRLDDAVAAYRKALDVEPANAQAWWGLSNLKTVQFNEADANAMRRALREEEMSADDRIQIGYALGKALDDLRNYAGAFKAYSESARLRLEQVPYDPQKVQNHVDKNRQTCTRAFFEARARWGSTSTDPIFIVSLPRSGSTLVEQILASHPLIEGTEELHDIERIALTMAPGGETGAWLDVLPSLTYDKVRELGEHYIDATRRFRFTSRPFFTDKMPSNWVFLGLIQTILPNAKIIDIRRHPMGCGFANFSQHFNWGINFSYDLKHIANFYSSYMRQMAHFDNILPGRIHHITYEDLIQNTEHEVRRLLNYVGLPFDNACLRFFENKRAVYTPSSEQVRSPINTHGLDRWKHYETFLAPLKEALGPVLEHYPDYPAEY